ncbi:MAG: hypothetical protein ACRCY3_03680 [Sphingorhabdus sp.]
MAGTAIPLCAEGDGGVTNFKEITSEKLRSLRWTDLVALNEKTMESQKAVWSKKAGRNVWPDDVQAAIDLFATERERRRDIITSDQLRVVVERALKTPEIKAIFDRVGRYGLMTDEDRKLISDFCDEQQSDEFGAIEIRNFRLMIPVLRRMLSGEWAGLDDPRVDALVERYRVRGDEVWKTQLPYFSEVVDFMQWAIANPQIYYDYTNEILAGEPGYEQWIGRLKKYGMAWDFETLGRLSEAGLGLGRSLLFKMANGQLNIENIDDPAAVEWLKHNDPHRIRIDFSEGAN